LPTGRTRDEVDGIAITCIDNGMPVVVLRADALGITGYEDPVELEANGLLRGEIESIRLAAGEMMGLGDVTRKTIPKMSLVAPPLAGGAIATRTFIPHRCHDAIGVLGAVSVATACLLPDSVAAEVAQGLGEGSVQRMDVEHPTGSFAVEIEVGPDGREVKRAALLRTARKLMSGTVFVPAAAIEGAPAAVSEPAAA
jgi:4-oxalomesaconate tautomerase